MKQNYLPLRFLTATVLFAFLCVSGVSGQATLMHSYTFEDGTANDVVGTAHGTLNGTGYSFADGAFVSATDGDFISFDGSVLALNTYSAITMEAYIRAGDGTNPGWTAFAYFGGATGTNAHFMALARGDDRSQTEYVGGATVIGPELDDGQLHHLVSVLTETTLSYYIDGVLMGTAVNTKSLADISLENAWLCKGGWPDPTWNGSIYEFNIYEGELNSTTIENNAIAFTGDARLASLTADVGDLNPVFETATTVYELVVPEGTTTVNLIGAANDAGATVTITSGGAIDVSTGSAMATVTVTAANGETSKDYTVYVAVGDANCFTPFFDDRANIINDPSIVDLSNFAGWGARSLNTDLNFVYCGATSGQVTGANGGSLDYDLDQTGMIKSNTTYRVRAQVYVAGAGQFQIGFWGLGVAEFAVKTKTVDAWETIDTTFTTGEVTDNMGMYFNNWQTGGELGYIDNWELYELSKDASLTDLMVNGVSVAGFDAATMTYDVVIPDLNPVVTATTTVAHATVEVTYPDEYPGAATVEVTAEDGVTIETYTINFTVTPPVLKHSYTFEDGTANDVVGTLHGTLNGTGYTFADGAFVSAENGDFISFDGSALALNTYSAITMEAYVRAGDGTNPGWTVLSYFGGAAGSNAYFMSIARGDDHSWTEYVGGGLVNGPELDGGELHHLVSVLTGTTILFYIDGVLIGTAPNTKSIADISVENAWLCKGGWPDPTWNGSIYEFNIFEGELAPSEISDRAAAFLNASDASLSDLTVDVGTLTPDFDPAVMHYAIAVPAGTTTVNVTATAKITGATLTGEGAVDLSGEPATASIEVTSADQTSTKTYTVDVLVGIDTDCFTPLYDDRANMIPDPEMTDVSLYQGWGRKSIAYGFEAYCGLSVMKFDAASNGWPDGAALDVNGISWNANSAYRVRFIYKTMDGSLGLLANMTDPNFMIPLPHTEGEWMEIDTVFLTGATPGTSFITINNVDASSSGKVAYIDNYELYEVSVDTTLTDLLVDGTTVAGFDATTQSYDVELPAGTTAVPAVTATAKDANATVTVTDAAGLPGTTAIEVLAEDGISTATYEINFTVAVELSDDATLSDLQVDGTTVTGFDAATVSYDVELPQATTDVPVVTATPTDANAAAVVTAAAALPGSTTVVVTAEDGTTTMTYTVNFTLAVGIENPFADRSIAVYPSISNSSFTVKTIGTSSVITVYDLYGKVIMQQQGESSEQQIHIQEKGMYLLNVTSEGETAVFKVIKTD